jgi:hypothetical protein
MLTNRLPEGEPPEAAAIRLDDQSPYRGGAFIQPAGHIGCSSGFGVHSRGNGADYVITAYHCNLPSDPRFWDGGNDFMGSVTSANTGLDAAFIKTSSRPWAFDGAWDNSTGYSKRVVGIRKPTTGTRICTSGSYSGVRCYGTISGAHNYRTTSRAGRTYTVHAYAAASGSEINGQGDSGGPVFTPSGSNVYAIGLISGQSTAVAYKTGCVGWVYTGRKCSKVVLFTSAWDISSQHNLDFVNDY